jgi:ATP-dependent DNA ligase
MIAVFARRRDMSLPMHPPLQPMEAQSVETLPTGGQWQYEPKWDGFRCLVFRDGDRVVLQSKAGRPLSRYFPEIVAAAKDLEADRFVLELNRRKLSDGHRARQGAAQ